MQLQPKPCKYCGSLLHYPFQCRQNPKPRKPIAKKGKATKTYETWRDTVAKPYLDSTYGHVCSYKSCEEVENLDVNHIKGRGSHPNLKMVLSNVEYLCRYHHRLFTDGFL